MHFLLFGLLLFFFSPLYGAEPAREDTLDPVVVTDSRLRDVEQPASRVPGKVITVTAD
jgi:hypothetical protein